MSVVPYAVVYLTGRRDETDWLLGLFSQVADIMQIGFEAMPS